MWQEARPDPIICEGKVNLGTPSGSSEINSENKRKLEEAIDNLYEDGKLDSKARFDTQDAAAKEVLEGVTPIADEYGLEVGGEIKKSFFSGKYRYTRPRVGTATNVRIGGFGAVAGYHTHPNSSVTAFSNPSNLANPTGGNDVGWVSSTRDDLYVGHINSAGSVSIGVCEYGNCADPLTGAPTKPTRLIVK